MRSRGLPSWGERLTAEVTVEEFLTFFRRGPTGSSPGQVDGN
ncbi:hypothetical protein ADILRU_0904 [Leifsonia rubra CMS 76R]|nr:hypothetical protein ADILRU_0904 [Leifsonia rubra CMS 76R]